MAVKTTITSMIIFVLFFIAFNSSVYADAALEVTETGKVSINTVLHLTPRSNPPATPFPGDIYFTTTEELLIYSKGSWVPILAAATAAHGTKLFTSGSGIWTVPEGIFSIQVTMAGGGGSNGSNITCYEGLGDRGGPVDYYGGIGGAGGVRLNNSIEVTPGQEFSYSVGGAGGSSSFGNLSVTGGGNGGNAVCGSQQPGSGSNGTNGSTGSPYEGAYPYGSQGNPVTGGAIYIQY